MSVFGNIRRKVQEVVIQFTGQEISVHPIGGASYDVFAAIGPVTETIDDLPLGQGASRAREIKVMKQQNTPAAGDLDGVIAPGWQGTIEIDGDHWAVDRVIAADEVGYHFSVTTITPTHDSGTGFRYRYRR